MERVWRGQERSIFHLLLCGLDDDDAIENEVPQPQRAAEADFVFSGRHWFNWLTGVGRVMLDNVFGLVIPEVVLAPEPHRF